MSFYSYGGYGSAGEQPERRVRFGGKSDTTAVLLFSCFLTPLFPENQSDKLMPRQRRFIGTKSR